MNPVPGEPAAMQKAWPIAFVVLFFLTRLIFLDRDLPPFDLTYYQTIDEFIYSWPAFNLTEHGSWAYQPLDSIVNEAWPWNAVQNLAGWCCLSVLGDNFYGLRMSSVLAGLACAAFIALIIQRIQAELGENPRDSSLARFWLTFLLLDFSYTLANRVIEPTMFRIVGMLVALAFLSANSFPDKLPKSNILACAAGFLCNSCWLWFYPTSCFVPLAGLFVVVDSTWKEGWAQQLRSTAAYLGGCILGAALWSLFLTLAYHQSPAEVIQYFLLDGLANGSRSRIGGLLEFRRVIVTNFLRFDWGLLFLILSCAPAILWLATKRKNCHAYRVCFIFALTFGLHTVPINDYSFKKLLIALPLFIFLLSGCWAARRSLHALILAHKPKVLTWLASIFGFCLGLAILCFFPKFMHEIALPGPGNWVTIAGLVVVAGWMFRLIFRPGEASENGILLLAGLLLGSTYLDARWIYGWPTFAYRDASASLASEFDGKLIAGGCSVSFRLYNQAEPALYRMPHGKDVNYWANTLKALVESRQVAGTIAYDNEESRAQMARAGLRFKRSLNVRCPIGIPLAEYVPADSQSRL